jgi:two-component system, LytTR family, sensor kinase
MRSEPTLPMQCSNYIHGMAAAPPVAQPGPSLPSPRLATSLALWTVPALLSTLETVAFAARAHHPIAVWRAFIGEAPQWYTWAVFTPAIVTLGRRFPLRRPIRSRNVKVHVLASALASAITALADAAVNAWARPSPRGILDTAENWFLGSLPATTLAYFAILGVSYALDNAAQTRDRERRAAELEAELRRTQLAALRMQLQPHFLFNSLNAIMSLVRDHDTARAMSALGLLSDVLRSVIGDNGNGSHDTTLSDEIEFVRRYLDIERLRFGERLTVRFDVPRALHNARVPIFVLQPFVENALKHGVLRDRGGNHIAVSASLARGMLNLRVRDDGRGLVAGDTPTGLGIANARARLTHLYGDDASLSVANVPDGPGVLVDITLPFVS